MTIDILDSLGLAFCIVLFVWAMQHVVFDDLANPIPSARLVSTRALGAIPIITVPPSREWRTGDGDVRA
jgi:hypothetical protein